MGKYVTPSDVQAYAARLDVLPANIDALIAQAEALAESPSGFGRSLRRQGGSPEPYQERILLAYDRPGHYAEAILSDAKPPDLPFEWVSLEGRPLGGGLLPLSMSLPQWVDISLTTIELDRTSGRLLVPPSPWFGGWREFRARFRVGWLSVTDVPTHLKIAISMIVEWLARGGIRFVRSVSQSGISFEQDRSLILPEAIARMLTPYRLL